MGALCHGKPAIRILNGSLLQHSKLSQHGQWAIDIWMIVQSSNYWFNDLLATTVIVGATLRHWKAERWEGQATEKGGILRECDMCDNWEKAAQAQGRFLAREGGTVEQRLKVAPSGTFVADIRLQHNWCHSPHIGKTSRKHRKHGLCDLRPA